MSENIYLHLLFFCGISCQGIFALSSENDTKLSSDVLVRNRRVINHESAQTTVRIETVSYIVKIKEGTRGICAGAIISHHTVITASICVPNQVSRYTVLSGALTDNRAKHHGITSKRTYFGNPPHREFEGIALMIVEPPFVYSGTTNNIQLHTGSLQPGTQGSVHGWGHLYPIQPGTEIRQKLRGITLPIMKYDDCKSIYHERFLITDKHICTYCVQQYCARNDEGAPLVVNNTLVGIHIWKGQFHNRMNPDVFINLQRPDYYEWIRENTILL